MTNDDGRKPEGAPERSPKAGAGAPSGGDGNGPKRFSVQRKMAIVARLLRSEPLELVARETNVSIARLWRALHGCGRSRAPASIALSKRRRRTLIRRQIDASCLHGEGYRKLWARLRFPGVRAS